MKKLNQRGVTTIELIITFSITLVLATSIFKSAVNFSERMALESNKLQINNYKNIVTKEIQNNLIENKVKNVTINSNKSTFASIDFTFKDNNISTLEIRTDYDNIYEIKYRTSRNVPFDLYELPNIGLLEKDDGSKTKALSFENISITNNNNIFKLKIKLNHPDLPDHYNINIVLPY